MQKIAVYGSLKKGFYNYRDDMGEPIAHGTVRGEMHLAYSYPHLYSLEDSDPELVRDHPVEVYAIGDEYYRMILGMELGAGYTPHEIEIVDNGVAHKAIIFYTRPDVGRRDNFIEGYTRELLNTVY